MDFNLLDEPWIPLLGTDGHFYRAGVMETLTGAGGIRGIAASNPMDRLAVLRFLLALLTWCRGDPPDESPPPPETGFPEDWFARLEEHRDGFNLLGDRKRFCQSRVKAELLSANYLVQEVPTGINPWHFRHATDEADGLCPACCALGLLRLPVFATSGGRGKPPGVNAKPPLYVVPVGPTLAGTLRLSWRASMNPGTPAWVDPEVPLPASGEVPLLTGLTWLPRRVWLEDPGEPGPCIACGRSAPLIRRTVFAGIGSTKTDADGEGRIWRDPHAVYETVKIKGRESLQSLHASNALGSPDAAATQWARIAAGILGDRDPSLGRRLWLVGFATKDNDKYLEAAEMELDLPALDDPERLARALESLRRWPGASKGIEKRFGDRSEGGAASVLAAVRPEAEARVASILPDLLTGGDEAWKDAAAGAYAPLLRMTAGALAPGFTLEALRRRRRIEAAVPHALSEEKPKRKPRREKGEKA